MAGRTLQPRLWRELVALEHRWRRRLRFLCGLIEIIEHTPHKEVRYNTESDQCHAELRETWNTHVALFAPGDQRIVLTTACILMINFVRHFSHTSMRLAAGELSRGPARPIKQLRSRVTKVVSLVATYRPLAKSLPSQSSPATPSREEALRLAETLV